MMNERLVRVFQEAFAVTEVDDGMSIGDVEGWDSLGHVGLMMVLQQEFGVKISPARAVQLTNVRSIREFVEQQGSTR